jgi:excisionase family DNA binding protein
MARSKSVSATNPAVAPSSPVLVNLKTAAQMLGCSTRTLRNRVYVGELHPIKNLGRSWLFSPDELQAFAQKLIERAA